VADTRLWLTVLVWIELTVILLVVTNTAATTLTREKESLTIELLLSTPLTSRYIIAGMLQGLVRLVIPLIGVPTLTVLLFAAADRLSSGPQVTTPEAVLLLPVLMVAFSALAAMIGLHFSLLSKKTVQAVMISTAIVLGASGLLSVCGYAVGKSASPLGAVVLPFTPIPGVQALLDPWQSVGMDRSYGTYMSAGATPTAEAVATFRITLFIFALAAAAVYLAITYALYNSMVRGFDMTVRRQSA
jgi:ABC-type transport system involved in multi-copper enzyme maturation permease subunit